MNDLEIYKQIASRAHLATKAAHEILAKHEAAQQSRAILLEDLLHGLSGLPVDIHNYFQEAIGCVQFGFLRAAHVLAWAGFIHVLVEKMYNNHLSQLQIEYPKWNLSSLSELSEEVREAQLIEAARKVGLISKSELKQYTGDLTTRNQCAHPTLYQPTLNSTIGFVDNMIRNTKKYI